MSGDVTAAIARLRKVSKVALVKSYIREDGRYTVSHDIDTVIDALRDSEHARIALNGQIKQAQGAEDSVSWVAALATESERQLRAEVERLRDEVGRERADAAAARHSWRDGLAEVERLRAEQTARVERARKAADSELASSFSTRESVADAIIAALTPLADQ